MDSYLRDDDGEALRAQRVAVALFIARRLGFPGTATEAEWRCVAEAAMALVEHLAGPIAGVRPAECWDRAIGRADADGRELLGAAVAGELARRERAGNESMGHLAALGVGDEQAC